MKPRRWFPVLALPIMGAVAACSDTRSSREGANPTPPPPRGRTRVVVLGTGTPNADPDRSGPSVAVVVDSQAWIIDAGPGVVRRAAAAARSGIVALEAPRLTRVLLTHLHSDHTVGLPDLIFTPWVLERAVPLSIVGPPGTKVMTDHILAAWEADIRNRIDGLEPANETGYRLEVAETTGGIIYTDSVVLIRAIAVPHGDWQHSLGFRFDTPDRRVVVSGDVRAEGFALADACNGCDVLVHEVYSARRFAERPSDWQRYHKRAHTSTVELAAIAARARPRLLVLYHQLYWGATDDDLIREIRAAGYLGPVVSARDLEVY
ncbi:MAG: MBL fold metallo-hydrolase [Gemmatimonadota bacterium]